MTEQDEALKQAQQFTQTVQEFQKQAEQRRAAMAKQQRYQHHPPDFDAMCRDWLKREAWTLDEAANLLSGYAPDRPFEFGGAEALRNSLMRADPERLPIVKRALNAGSRQFKAADVLAWARRHDVALPAALGGARGTTQSPAPTRPAYETPLMRIMYEAIYKFWADYDPDDPNGHYPKSEEIITWLKNERRLSGHQARAIDMIIRHESRSEGGQTKRKG